MLLKKKKLIPIGNNKTVRFNRIRKFTRNLCNVCTYEKTDLCVGTLCSKYVYNKGYSSIDLRRLKYFYFISQLHVI